MDFLLSDDQRALLDGLQRILEERAGTTRASSLAREASYDHDLHEVLEETGFFDVARGDETGPLEAALVVDAVARSVGTVAVGAAALVVPAVCADAPDGPVVLAERGTTSPVRYAPAARTVLALDADDAWLIPLRDGDVTPLRSTFGGPVGTIDGEVWDRGVSLGEGSGTTLARWWQVAVAVEAAALMDAALRSTVQYVNQREQFGHPIGAFQAVQHRLAECAVVVEGSIWLAREAADRGAPVEAAAAACAYATSAARRVFAETHQLSGAIGFTKEFDLYLWTTRAMGLTLELGGSDAHALRVARARWGW